MNFLSFDYNLTNLIILSWKRQTHQAVSFTKEKHWTVFWLQVSKTYLNISRGDNQNILQLQINFVYFRLCRHIWRLTSWNNPIWSKESKKCRIVANLKNDIILLRSIVFDLSCNPPPPLPPSHWDSFFGNSYQ